MKAVLHLNTEIQDGRQKWQENVFWRKLSRRLCRHPVGQKVLVEIALFQSVSEINTFLRFTSKFKMATKSGGKIIFGESPPVGSAYTM